MRWMIASDIHGSAAYCRRLLEAYDRERAERLILLGDLLYHGPRNDLPEEYAPKEVIRLLNERKRELLCVRGNCDTEVDQMVLEFPIMADYLLLAVPTDPSGSSFRTIFATHGHHYHLGALPPLMPGDILLHGHTHIPAWEPFGEDNLYLNPGSVAIPKEGSPRGYTLLENGRMSWRDLAGEEYHALTL